MKTKNEIVPIQIHDQPKKTRGQKKTGTAKLTLCIRRKDCSELLIYNGANSYILSAILKELA